MGMSWTTPFRAVIAGAMFFAVGRVVADTPIGLEAMEQFDRIGELRQGFRTYQASSHDPSGGNFDTGNFLQVVGDENVLLDVKGPGCVYRIWMTGIDLNGLIRIYFDGAATPTIEMPLGDFFSGRTAPFLAPLVGDDNYSSGGFICYLPMEFEQGCRITTESFGHYYNIIYQMFADATGVTTFTGTEDSSAVRAMWRDHGSDPKVDQGTTELTAIVTVPAGGAVTLADIDQAGSIQQIELTLPGMETPAIEPVWDDGRAHVGYSEFVAQIDPANTGVRITRRLDYGIGNQKADVYVDGTFVGEWYTPGSGGGWLDDTFEVPGSFTSGNASVTVRMVFVSSNYDWNEFYYWVDSLVAGEPVRTDELDIADMADEADHSYVISQQTWEGSRTFYYGDGDEATDDGRATMDWVEFDVALDEANSGVNLTRRLDYSIADQRGNVYVDGVLAGEWHTEGQAGGYFLDDTFEIPGALTAGKSGVAVRIQFISSAIDWNEFRYWVDSIVGGEPMRTDELDVGDETDEAAHNYTIENQTWEGTRTFPLYTPADPVFLEILENARLVATWDSAASPQVDVPLGSLFGSNLGPRRINGLPVGIEDDRMYCWFPMPFAGDALVQLINDSSEDINALECRLRYTPRTPEAFAGLGHFHARYNQERPCTVGRDYTILEETGAGHFVGVVQVSQGPDLGYLEGDERIYVDGSLTPALYGTGTEDFYNGGWYFNRGRFSRPVHGNPTMEGSPVATDMYRYFLSDLIPFTTSIKVGIEHGGVNDTPDTDICGIALYYKQAEPLATLTDELDVGDADSEAAHSYVIDGQTWSGSLTHTYEGDDDGVPVTDDGRQHNHSSQFVVALDPCNGGVLLRRRMDYGLPRQEAEVYVDDALAGVWYDAGQNGYHRFRDSEFTIGPALTRSKSQIGVRLVDVSASSDWSEFRYCVYTLLPAREIPGDIDGDGDVDLGDLAALLAAYGACDGDPGYNRCADFDGSGCIDLADLSTLLANYGAGA
jgi:hypothetical protein